jgi:hypothetical protein
MKGWLSQSLILRGPSVRHRVKRGDEPCPRWAVVTDDRSGSFPVGVCEAVLRDGFRRTSPGLNSQPAGTPVGLSRTPLPEVFHRRRSAFPRRFRKGLGGMTVPSRQVRPKWSGLMTPRRWRRCRVDAQPSAGMGGPMTRSPYRGPIWFQRWISSSIGRPSGPGSLCSRAGTPTSS